MDTLYKTSVKIVLCFALAFAIAYAAHICMSEQGQQAMVAQGEDIQVYDCNGQEYYKVKGE